MVGQTGGENAWRSVGSVFVNGAAAGTCYKQIAQAVESQTPQGSSPRQRCVRVPCWGVRQAATQGATYHTLVTMSLDRI